MRKSVFLFLLVGIFMVGIVSGACPSGLVSYWTMDNGDLNGNTVIDVAGSNNGTNNGATIGAIGVNSEAFDFDGLSNSISIPSDNSLNVNSAGFSVSLWVKPRSYAASGYMEPFRRESACGFHLGNTGGNYRFAIKTDSGSQKTVDVAQTEIVLNDWSHLVLMFNGSSVHAYVNGVEKGTPAAVTWGAGSCSNQNLYIGAYNSGNRFFDGLIDEFAIFDRGLTSAEITEIYNNGIAGNGVCGAVTECSPDNTIMKLYQDSNSHGALWDDAVYDVDICFDGPAPATPHPVCDDGNSFLWLYQDSNSHVSTTKTADYATGVCYGDMECTAEVISDGSNCSDGTVPLLSLYSSINSHMAAGDFPGYDTKICCVASQIYWANADGVPINSSDEVNIGDTVQAVVTNTASGTFTIWEDDFIGDDNITTIVGENIGGNWVGLWTITQADLDKTLGLDSFYFKLDGGDKSEYINISATYNDSAMDVMIVSPACGSDYDMGTTVTIDVLASDEDDYIDDGTVKVNGVLIPGATFENGMSSFDYDFVLAGNYQIVAEATNTRGKRARHIANVMIVNTGDVGSKYVAACILEPKDYSNIDESVVDFDASTTKAIVVLSGGAKDTISPGSSRLSWYWRFEPEGIIREFTGDTSLLAYKFTAEFPIAGDNSAILRVEFE